MKNRIFIVCCSILLFWSSKAVYSQNHNIGNWLAYMGNQKINSKWNFHNEIQLRNYNFIGDQNQLLIRLGIGRTISMNNNILLGYAHFTTSLYEDNSGNKTSIIEHRIFQQFLNKTKYKGCIISNRIRLEERFFKNDFKLRLRYYFLFNKALNKKEITKNALYFSSYNEIFLNTKNNIFDRNRIYAGLGYAINNSIKFETGYMIQTLSERNQKQFQFILFNNLSF